MADSLQNIATPAPPLLTTSITQDASVTTLLSDGGLKQKLLPSKPLVQYKVLSSEVQEEHAVLENLTSVGVSKTVPSNALVIGENVPGGVVVDIHGNVVVQDCVSVQTPGGASFLMNEPLLVKVDQKACLPVQDVNAINESKQCDESHVLVREKIESSLPRKTSEGSDNCKSSSEAKLEAGDVDGSKCKGDKNKLQANIKSRWNFREVKSKSNSPVIPVSEVLPTSDQSSNEETLLSITGSRFSRKSALRARQNWNNIYETTSGGCIGVQKLKRKRQLTKNQATSKIEELPVWAKRLTSVRVIDSKWVVGIAASNQILQQTLEEHSRSVLCDYIKSHPSALESRHRLHSQASRIMWQRNWIEFDGVPFSIISSDHLKCRFGMNYKLKRKTPVTVEGQDEGNDVEDPDCNDGRKEDTASRKEDPASVKLTKDSSKLKTNSCLPKKRYKDITFTSCPAHINVKVLRKYPGYAVPLNFTSMERTMMLHYLRKALDHEQRVEMEEVYFVTMPLALVHNHALQGQSRNVHPSIISKIREYVDDGVTFPRTIKRNLEAHLKNLCDGDLVIPQPDDRAYYPNLKDISNIIYTHCKKKGIPLKRKRCNNPCTTEPRKKKTKLKISSQNGNENNCSDDLMTRHTVAVQATTLQEAVETFCKDDHEPVNLNVLGDQGSASVMGDRDLAQRDVGLRIGIDVPDCAEMVRDQLNLIRNLTYSLNDINIFQDMYNSLQVIINRYTQDNPQGSKELRTEPAGTTAFIIPDSIVNPLVSSASDVQSIPQPATEQLVTSENSVSGSGALNKPRNFQSLGSPQIRHVRPPVAVQCLTTNMVPTLAVSQLPRAMTQTSQVHTPVVMSLPSHSSSNPPAASSVPTYQTLSAASQDCSQTSVQVSLPPYFYYVQEVTAPDSSQNWSYSEST